MFNNSTTILEKYYNFIAEEKNFRKELQFMKRIAIQQKITITGRITNIEKYSTSTTIVGKCDGKWWTQCGSS